MFTKMDKSYNKCRKCHNKEGTFCYIWLLKKKEEENLKSIGGNRKNLKNKNKITNVRINSQNHT